MTIRKLKIIPEPPEETRTVFKKDNSEEDTVIFRGSGDQDYVCGACGALLVSQIQANQLRNLVLLCNQCGKHNEIA